VLTGEKQPSCCQQNNWQETKIRSRPIHAIPPEYWKLDARREHSGARQWNQQYTPHPQGDKTLNALQMRSGGNQQCRGLLTGTGLNGGAPAGKLLPKSC